MSVDWIEASRSPLIPGTRAHASAITPLVLFLVHIAWWTLGVVMSVVITLAILNSRGITMSWLLRRQKSRLRGGRLSARPVFYRRRLLQSQSIAQMDVKVLRAN